MRSIGWTILISGIVGAGAFYWTAAGSAQLDDLNALGYRRSMEHGIGVMMGPSGAVLTDLQQRLTSPLGEALMIAAVAALFAVYFFRVAWVIDSENREEAGH
jgi:nitrogen fixation-related uncharacterized protein